MLKIGITGGIGTGKSTVCNVFKILGIPVFDADTVAKKLYNTNAELKDFIRFNFGENIYTNEIFNRKVLAEIVFKSGDKLAMLNTKIHPLVQLEFEKWLDLQKSNYVIKEAALMIESGSYKNLDINILITCPLQKRIERVIRRDKTTQQEVTHRINKQMPEEEKRKYCDFEIINDDQVLLIPQVFNLNKIFLSMSEV